MSLVTEKMFPGSLFGVPGEMFAGSIESLVATTGVSGRFLETLSALPPEILVLLDTAHIWGPFAALIGFLLFGPLGGGNRFTRHAGNATLGGLGFLGSLGSLSHRAWFAFSTAVTIRQVVLWFVNLTPVKGALLSVGIEIIPARRGRNGTAGQGSSSQFSSPGNSSGGVASGTLHAPSADDYRRVCFASNYDSLTNVPTAINPTRAPDVVSTRDYHEFKERMAGMPSRLPTLETNGTWVEMMHKSSADGMHYRAWRHVLPYGGTEYLSRTMFENATVEEMVDFFGCDDTRASWDRLLFRHRVLERDEKTGAEVVFWERALPVISNRDYVFSRRTFKDPGGEGGGGDGIGGEVSGDGTGDGGDITGDASGDREGTTGGDTYWAITKGTRHVGSPETPGLKRVDPYFSSWRMRAVIGADGRLSASECILSHFEEQHVNQDVARFAVKCGMWGVVKNMGGGFRKFQRDRAVRHEAASRETALLDGDSNNDASGGSGLRRRRTVSGVPGLTRVVSGTGGTAGTSGSSGGHDSPKKKLVRSLVRLLTRTVMVVGTCRAFPKSRPPCVPIQH
jgi:hypothetical protein|tara:strand:- start:298 stop:1995 length:1698 start_codon:yes stop_codon:yes gene_type:complete